MDEPIDLTLLSVDEMYTADAGAIAAGVNGETLMENAGRGLADAIVERWGAGQTVILCGPGNNGGDGFVAARHLEQAGFTITVALLGERASLKGDAGIMAARWGGEVVPLEPGIVAGADLIVDGIFGAGLSRSLEGVAAATVAAVNDCNVPVVAIDVPSGVHGDSGAILGTAARADLTVTFFLRKPGHLLMPGRELMGEVVTIDIATPRSVLESIAPQTYENGVGLWQDVFPWPSASDHKYSRGHAIVVSGPINRTGAARLAARSALRAGAGLVTLACPPAALLVNAIHLTSVMCTSFDGSDGLVEVLEDPRRNVVLLGPGNGTGQPTRDNVLATLALDKGVVLDADALTAFEETPASLFDAINGACVLTPHEGEFRRLFPDIKDGSKLRRARKAAKASGATILFKGSDTVVASPDGLASINTSAPPELATAGSGDVLAGLITGLIAQGMPTFAAASAGAWLHGVAGATFGPGLIAEDIVEHIPDALRLLRDEIEERP